MNRHEVNPESADSLGPIVFRTLRESAARRGIAVVSVLRATPFPERDTGALRQWIEEGFHGELKYMERVLGDERDLRRLLQQYHSVVVFAVPYPAEQATDSEADGSTPRIARYAWGRDYHRVLRKELEKVLFDCGLEKKHFRIATDSVPLLERSLGVSVSIGFVGKNTLVIRPRVGSYFFLAEALLATDIVQVPLQTAVEGKCGSCSRCLDQCPTQAFESPYVLNATRCISYLTIEKRGVLSRWERNAIGNWLFGCDICQEVCPFNHTRSQRDGEKLLESFRFSKPRVDLRAILGLRTDKQFEHQFAGTPIMRAKREGLLRNACCVAANTGSARLFVPLIRVALHDSSEVVRLHAVWAIGQLSQSIRKRYRLIAVDALQKILREEASAALRGEIYWCLLNLGETSSVPAASSG